MLINLRDVKRQKGQGIVEYALLLAFILAIAVAMQGSGIDSAIANTFTRVAQALGVETEQDRWATANASDLLADTASAQARLESDKEFLTNIGKHFIGMSKDDLKNNYNISGSGNTNILLGHLVENRDEQGNLISTSFDTSGAVAKNTGDFYNWATGAADGSSYDTTKRYLFSDYALNNAEAVYGGQKTGNGIKITNIQYDSDNKVKRVVLSVNPQTGVGNKEDLTVNVE